MNLSTLNPEQYEAVTCLDRNLLVLAGAGSGKTRVITLRVAYLINELGFNPGQILGLTFTNKAAGEMKERVQKLTDNSVSGLFLGTFHSYALKNLRKYIHLLGFNHRFIIYDESDVVSLLRRIAREEFPEKNISARLVATRISLYKNSMISIKKSFELFPDQLFPLIYREYTRTMKTLNALDFDDLLIRFNEILVRFPEIQEELQKRLSHILVDEFQDTNSLQLFLLKKLYHPECKICVVGDDDQSIYAWRGAQVRNILEFERVFGNTRTIRLEQNYRSTENILQAANGIISRNIHRSPKKLWTEQGKGKAISFYSSCDADEEVRFVTGEISALLNIDCISPNNIAVLYRSNNQSRYFEAALRKKGIPYRILGGKELFDRAEVKDVLAYMKLFVNPDDDNSLLRIINVPQRLIGKQSVEKLRQKAVSEKLSLFQVISNSETFFSLNFPASTLSSLKALKVFIDTFRELFTHPDLASSLFTQFLNELHYYDYLIKIYGKKDNTIEAEKRYENVLALSKLYKETLRDNPKTELSDYINMLSIDNLMDNKASEAGKETPAVTLLTIHSSKGLEFDIVFLVGFEEGLIPHRNAIEQNNTAEERRLCYVAFTRAKSQLYISQAKSRKLYGKEKICRISSFFQDIPEECLQYFGVEKNKGDESISLQDSWKKIQSRLNG